MEIGARDGGLNAYLRRVKGDVGKFVASEIKIPIGAMLAGGAVASAAAIAAGMIAATKAASDLNEQVSKASVVFGPAAAGVTAEAQKMADAFGVPKTEFIDAASSIGLIGKASGLTQGAAATLGTEFAKLGIDASSFYNVPLADALMAIRSGLVGEAEPMRRFGVLLSAEAVQAEAARMGLVRLGGTLTEGMKVQARASLITKGMADAHGDMARTADGAANQMRKFQGQITNGLADAGLLIQPLTDGMLWFANALAQDVASGLAYYTHGVQEAADATEDLQESWSTSGGDGGTWDVEAAKAELLAAAAARAAASLKLLAPYREALVTAGMSDGDKAMREVKKKGGSKADVKEAGRVVVATGRAEASARALDLGMKLRDEARTFGMSSEAAELYKLKMRGAAPSVIAMAEAHLKNAEAMEAAKKKADELDQSAKKVFDETRTPAEKLGADLARLRELRDAGKIGPDTFERARQAAAEQTAKGTIGDRPEKPAFQSQVLDASSMQRSIQAAALSTKDDTAKKHLEVATEAKKLLADNLKELRKAPSATYR